MLICIVYASFFFFYTPAGRTLSYYRDCTSCVTVPVVKHPIFDRTFRNRDAILEADKAHAYLATNLRDAWAQAVASERLPFWRWVARSAGETKKSPPI